MMNDVREAGPNQRGPPRHFSGPSLMRVSMPRPPSVADYEEGGDQLQREQVADWLTHELTHGQ